MKARKQ